MRFLRKALTGLFLAAVSAALLVWAGATLVGAMRERMARDGFTRPGEERVYSARVVTVTARTIAPVLTTFGEVRSRRTLELRMGAGGRIVALSPNFEEGGQVTAGELLAAVDPADAESALALARADLAEAEAALSQARTALGLAGDELASAEGQAELRDRALARARDLAERGVGTEAGVEAAELAVAQAGQAVLVRRQAVAGAEAALDQARGLLDRRRIALAEAERAVGNTRLVAAFAGTLANVSAVEGGLVAANERLADLIDPAALEVSFRLSTAQYARLLDGEGRLVQARIEAVLDAAGFDLAAGGRITRAAGAVAEGQTGRLIFAALDGAAGFRPGDFVTLRIVEPPLDGVALLPATALDGSGTVLALGPEDRLESLPVEVLRRQGDDVIVRAGEGAGGLAGREVVAERSALLGAGIKVRPIRPDGAALPADTPEMVELSPERRAALIAFVEANTAMPAEARARVLAQLRQDRVPARVVERIEARMGG